MGMISREEAEKYIIEEKKVWEDKFKNEMSFEVYLGFLVLEEKVKHNDIKKRYSAVYRKYITEELKRIETAWYNGEYKKYQTEEKEEK